jgi:O-antigen ligase
MLTHAPVPPPAPAPATRRPARIGRPARTGALPRLGAPVRLALAPLAWLLAGVQSGVRRPSLLVALTVLLVMPPSQVQDVSNSGHVTPADLAAGLVILAVVVRLLGAAGTGTGPAAATVNPRGLLPFAAAVTAFAAATITAVDVATSVKGFIRYSELFVLIPVAVAMSLRDRLDVLLAAGAIVAVSAVEGTVGGYQYLTKTGASYGGEYIRAVGTFGADQVLALGALLGYGIVVTLALGLALRGRARTALVALAGALVVPLGLSLSRGAWIATAAAVLLTLLVFNWRAALAAGCALGLAVAVASLRDSATGTAGNERLTSIVSSGNEPDRSVRDRYALWSAAGAMWADHPILGVGMKDFATYRDSYAPMALSAGSDVDDRGSGFRREPLLSAHNQYLMVAAEQGTVGILAFGTLLGTLAVTAVWRRREDAWRDAVSPQPVPVHRRFLDLAAPGLMAWTLIDFMYGDVGAGPTSVLLGVLLGLVARRLAVVPAGAQPATGPGGAAS